MNYLKYGLLLLLLFCSNLVFSKEAVICNSCFSVTEFKSFTQGYHGNIVGTRDYQVVNYATEEVWDVTVTGWYDDIDFEGNPYGGNGIFLSYAEAELPSLSDINDVKALISAFKNEGDHLVVLPPNSPRGGASFATRDQQYVGGTISVHPLGLLGLRKVSLFNAIKRTFGFGKILITVVFNNGDTAVYELVNPQGNASGCCVYVPGTGRDNQGRVLSDANGNIGAPGEEGRILWLGLNPNTGGWHFNLYIRRTTWKCYQLPPPRVGVACFKEN